MQKLTIKLVILLTREVPSRCASNVRERQSFSMSP
jgi:hypothetical protein